MPAARLAFGAGICARGPRGGDGVSRRKAGEARVLVVLILFQQVVTMMLLMGLGVFLSKSKILPDDTTKNLGRMLVTVIIPVVVFRAFHVERTEEGVANLGVCFVLSLVALLLSSVVSYAIYGRRHPEDTFGSAYSNPSFFAIPLIQATYGEDAVFYIVFFIALLNVFQWTFGAWLLTGDRKTMSLRAIVTNPVLIAAVLGVVTYLLAVPLPGVVVSGMDMLAECNTPLAMIVLGSYLAKLSVRDLLLDGRAYVVCLVRLVVEPLATILLARAFGLSSTPLVMSVLLAAISPVGANVAIFAQHYDGDYREAVKLVSLSTIMTIATIPAMFQLALMVL